MGWQDDAADVAADLREINGDPFNAVTNPGGLDGPGGVPENFPRVIGSLIPAALEVMATAVSDVNFTAARASVATALATVLAAQWQQQSGAGATSLVYPQRLVSLLTAADVVDVCVYDTSRDSDGGAWTERCRHTSWYAEALGTPVRGLRRSFPRVALIVARASSLTIYDAHDLDAGGVPRMWMVFNAAGAAMLVGAGASYPITGLAALEGRIVVSAANSPAGSLMVFDFPADAGRRWTSAARTVWPEGIASRNAGTGYVVVSGSAGIVGVDCRHCAAAVLPGAPLDGAGLRIPTLAVATSAGASVIHPDGLVCDITGPGAGYRAVAWDGSRMWLSQASSGAQEFGPLPYADTASGAWRAGYAAAAAAAAIRTLPGNDQVMAAGALGGSGGLALVAEEWAAAAQSLVATIGTGYTSGWQCGDMRLAGLCDGTIGSATAATPLDTDLSSAVGWTLTSAAHNAGAGTIDMSGGSIADYALAGLVPGQAYLVTVVVGAYTSGAAEIRCPAAVPDTAAAIGAAGTFIKGFVATAAAETLRIIANPTFTASLTAVTVRAATADRGWRGRHLAVVGNPARAAVATGAELAAWSGFGSAAGLDQPYNADLDMGTGDWWIRLWVLCTAGGSTQTLLERRLVDGTGPGIRINRLSDGSAQLSIVGAAGSVFPAGGALDGRWACIDAVRRGSAAELWVDAVPVATADLSAVGTLSSVGAVLRLGARVTGAEPATQVAGMAMLRWGVTAPSPAQIRRMHRDERALFRPGAAAFLGGGSASVNGLARDPDSGTLAVATGDGVSVFSGLSRVAYHDGASAPGAVGSDTVNRVAAGAGMLLVATATNAGWIDPGGLAKDRMPAGPRGMAAGGAERWVADGVTTDATPLDLAPRLAIGVRETAMVEVRVVGRVRGSADGQRGAYVRRGTVYRDAGGNVTLQGSVQAIGSDTEVTSGADATLVLDTAAQTVAVRVTGVAATRIVWRAEWSVVRISEGERYAEG